MWKYTGGSKDAGTRKVLLILLAITIGIPILLAAIFIPALLLMGVPLR